MAKARFYDHLNAMPFVIPVPGALEIPAGESVRGIKGGEAAKPAPALLALRERFA